MPDIEYYTGAYTGEEIDEAIGRAIASSNGNLLDNSYFAGGGSQNNSGNLPINQRASTSYTQGNGTQKIFDRWNLIRGTVTLAASGVTLKWDGVNGNATTLRQVIAGTPLTGKKVTLALLYGNGRLLQVSTTMAANTNVYSATADSLQLHLLVNNGNTLIDINCTSTTGVTLIAVGLYLGDYQLLAHPEGNLYAVNSIPSFSQEYLKCLRYLWAMPRYSNARATAVRTNDIYFSIATPAPMLSSPTSPTILNSGDITLATLTGSAQSGFTYSITTAFNGMVVIDANKSSHGLSDAVIGCSTGHIYISSEL